MQTGKTGVVIHRQERMMHGFKIESEEPDCLIVVLKQKIVKLFYPHPAHNCTNRLPGQCLVLLLREIERMLFGLVWLVYFG